MWLKTIKILFILALLPKLCFADVIFSDVAIENLNVAGSEPLIFMAISDVHYTVLDIDGYYSETSNVRLQDFVDTANNRDNVDFIINLGDLIDCRYPVEKATLNLETTDAILSSFIGDAYSVLGNHDVDTLENFLSVDEYLAISNNISTPYYSFSKKGIHFVVLFTSDLGFSNSPLLGWYMSQTQLNWLANDLSSNAEPTIIFTHIRIDLTEDANVSMLKNSADVRAILEADSDVFAVFQGHNHVNAFNDVNGIKYFEIPNSKDVNNSIYVKIWKNKAVRIEGFGTATDRPF